MVSVISKAMGLLCHMHKLSVLISGANTNVTELSLPPYSIILKRVKAIHCDAYIPEKGRTIKVLVDLLWETPTSSGHECSEGEALRVALVTEVMPWLEKSLGSSQQIWKVLERNGRLYGLKRC